MEEKVTVVLLGNDASLLKNVTDRINSTRPAEVSFFLSIKDFLEHCIEAKPDLIGVSVSYPHKSTGHFPKVFKAALKTSVLTFGENQELKTRKLLSASTADLKITGVITAHNLWMKIVNFQKLRDKDGGSKLSSGDDSNENTKINGDATHLKGSAGNEPSAENKNSLLNNLFAALDNPEKMKNPSNLNLVKSGGNSSKSVADGSENQTKGMNSSQRSKSSSMNSPESSDGHQMLTSTGGADTLDPNGSSQSVMTNGLNSGNKTNDSNAIGGGNQKKSMNPQVGNGKNGSKSNSSSSNDFGSDLGNFANAVSSSGQPGAASSETSAEGTLGKSAGKDDSQTSPIESKNGKGSSAGQQSKKTDQADAGDPQNSKNKKDNNPISASSSSEKSDIGSNKKKRSKKDSKKALPYSLEESKPEEEKSDFGKVKVAEAEVDKNDKNQKTKEQEEKEREQKKNILLECCQTGLEKAFQSKPDEKPLLFSTKKMVVFIVESGSFQGYVVLAESRETKGEGFANDFRDTVVEQLQQADIECDFSMAYWISIDVENYPEAVKQFAEFSINNKDSEGFQQSVSFVQREAVRPSFQDSDRPEMYNVDIKVIPPQTPVNFDAFLYLPINQKFVRYLKQGRSLSLKQSKRHSEEEETSKLYLPKEQKNLFVSFYIQNTLNWEFTLHKSQKAS